MSFTVTATQGNGANGMALRVFVLTQAAAVQNGATSNTQFGATQTHTQSITTTQSGSRVYGAGYRDAGRDDARVHQHQHGAGWPLRAG